MARVVCEVRPRYVFVENSPMLTLRGLGTVLKDLAAMGYDAKWCVLGACDAGAPHKRERIWMLAYLANAKRGGLQSGDEQCAKQAAIKSSENCGYSRRMQLGEAWRIEPDLGRVAYGVAFGVDRLKAIGNGQVPAVAALAWRTLSEGII